MGETMQGRLFRSCICGVRFAVAEPRQVYAPGHDACRQRAHRARETLAAGDEAVTADQAWVLVRWWEDLAVSVRRKLVRVA